MICLVWSVSLMMILFGLFPPHLRVDDVGRGEDEDVTDDDEDRAEDDIGLLQSG